MTASWLGVVNATVLGGVGSILIALLWMRLFPGLRRLDNLAAPRLQPAEQAHQATEEATIPAN